MIAVGGDRWAVGVAFLLIGVFWALGLWFAALRELRRQIAESRSFFDALSPSEKSVLGQLSRIHKMSEPSQVLSRLAETPFVEKHFAGHFTFVERFRAPLKRLFRQHRRSESSHT